MGMKNSCNWNAKNRRKTLLEKKNCHKTRPIFFRHLPDFLRYRGPSNILHNKYTNVLCLLGTRGRENVFLKYKSKWNSAAYNLYTYEIKAGCSRTCCHSEREKQPFFVNLNLFYKFRTPPLSFSLESRKPVPYA